MVPGPEYNPTEVTALTTAPLGHPHGKILFCGSFSLNPLLNHGIVLFSFFRKLFI